MNLIVYINVYFYFFKGGILGADRNGSDIDDDEMITRRPDESEFNATVKCKFACMYVNSFWLLNTWYPLNDWIWYIFFHMYK